MRINDLSRARLPRLASVSVAFVTAFGLTCAEHSQTNIFLLGILAGWALMALAVLAIYGAIRALIRADDRENAAENLRRSQET